MSFAWPTLSCSNTGDRRTGYGYWFSNEQLSNINRDTGKDHDDLPLVHEPGAKWTYGCSTRILGFLVERVSKERLDDYFDSHIFQPLGMNDSGFRLESRDLQRLVTVHRHTRNGVVEDAIKSNEDGEIVGDYGLRSNASDYAKFLQMFLNGGELNGSRILSSKSVRQMTTNQIGNLVVLKQPAPRRWVSREFPLGAGADKFGLGFQLASTRHDGQRSPGSYSWAGIYNTHFWVDPDRKVAVVLMMQVLPFYDEGCIELLRGFEERLNHGLDG